MSRCGVEGCGRKPRSLGLCSVHYQRLRRHGDVTRGRVDRPKCSACGREQRRDHNCPGDLKPPRKPVPIASTQGLVKRRSAG